MSYDIQRDDWSLKTLRGDPNADFNYFSAATTLPNGEILISGGGISQDVFIINVDKLKITKKAPMIQNRKEHSIVQLQNAVYALGGFDGENFLKTCERYDLEKDEWKFVSSMKIPKCAFASSVLNNRFIYVFGGYDGMERLNTIEKFDSEFNRWDVLQLKLRKPLSNAAAVSPRDDTIVLLGKFIEKKGESFFLEKYLFLMHLYKRFYSALKNE